MARDPFFDPSSLRINRRGLLKGAAVAGAGAAGFPALSTSAAPSEGPTGNLRGLRANDPNTLTLAMDALPTDLDPHSAYDYRSALAILGAYEGLITLKDDKTDEYEGMIAESWRRTSTKASGPSTSARG